MALGPACQLPADMADHQSHRGDFGSPRRIPIYPTSLASPCRMSCASVRREAGQDCRRPAVRAD